MYSTSKTCWLSAGCVSLLVFPIMSLANGEPNQNTLTDESYKMLISKLTSLIPRSIVGPAIYGIPSGFGLGRGQGYASGSITNHRTEDSEAKNEEFDGSYAFGIGLSDPIQALGIDVNLGILSSTPGNQTETGNYSLKVHKQVPSPYGPFAIAVGANNVAPWGDPERIKTSYYFAASQIIHQTYTTLVLPDIMISAGMSDGASNGGREAGAYLGIAAKYTSTSSVSVSWSGDEIISGVTFQPRLGKPVMVSAGVGDIFNQNDDQRILLSVTYALNNLF